MIEGSNVEHLVLTDEYSYTERVGGEVLSSVTDAAPGEVEGPVSFWERVRRWVRVFIYGERVEPVVEATAFVVVSQLYSTTLAGTAWTIGGVGGSIMLTSMSRYEPASTIEVERGGF